MQVIYRSLRVEMILLGPIKISKLKSAHMLLNLLLNFSCFHTIVNSILKNLFPYCPFDFSLWPCILWPCSTQLISSDGFHFYFFVDFLGFFIHTMSKKIQFYFFHVSMYAIYYFFLPYCTSIMLKILAFSTVTEGKHLVFCH